MSEEAVESVPEERSQTEAEDMPKRRSTKMTDVVSLGDTEDTSYRYVRAVLSLLPDDIARVIKDRPMTRKAMDVLNKALHTVTTGTWSVFPLTCAGEGCPEEHLGPCPYGKRCPLLSAGVPPVGSECPVEKQAMLNIMQGYMEELDVSPSSTVEVGQVANIAMCDIMIMRVNNQLSKKAGGYADLVAVGMDENGNVMVRRGVSTEVLVVEKYHKMKSSIMEDLLATRESRAKYRRGSKADVGTSTASLLKKAALAVDAEYSEVDDEVGDN